MQTSTPLTPASPIPVPEIESDEPVAVIPVASVAPLDGPPDGERINTFTLAPKHGDGSGTRSGSDAMGQLRERVLASPVAYLAGAFSLGFLLARVLR